MPRTSSAGPKPRATIPWIPTACGRDVARDTWAKEGDGRRGWRRDTDDGDGHRSAPQYHLPGKARERTRGAGLRQRQDAEELHPHPAGRQSRGGSVTVRFDERADYLPVQIEKRKEKGVEETRKEAGIAPGLSLFLRDALV